MPKVAIVYDVHVDGPAGRIGWAFWRRATALAKYAPPDFDVQIFRFLDMPWDRSHEFDLVFNLEMAQTNRAQVKRVRDVPLVMSWNADSQRRREWWPRVYREADWVICNNVDAFGHYGRLPRTCAISNGIDGDLWRPIVPIEERPDRVIWTGSSNPAKGKGYAEILQHLQTVLPRLGFETDFRPINHVSPELVLTTEQMIAWYNSASYVLCASASEGTPGIISEGVACGCVAVTTAVGNVREWGRDMENCVLVERNANAFIEGLEYARVHRKRLSKGGASVLQNQWSYGEPGARAKIFWALFRKIIMGESVAPFAWNDQ